MYAKIEFEVGADATYAQFIAALGEIATTAAGSDVADDDFPNLSITTIDNSVAGGWTVLDRQSTVGQYATTYGGSEGSYASCITLTADVGNGKTDYDKAYLRLWYPVYNYWTSTSNSGYPGYPYVTFGFLDSANDNPGDNAKYYYQELGNQTTNIRHFGYPQGTKYNSGSTSYSVETAFGEQVMWHYDAGKNNNTITSSRGSYFVMANSEAIHIHAGSPYGHFFHFGKRTNLTWEGNYTDNPYWVAMWQSYYYKENNSYHWPNIRSAAGYYTIMRGFNPVNQSEISPQKVNYYNASMTTSTTPLSNWYDPFTGTKGYSTNSTSRSVHDGHGATSPGGTSTYNMYYQTYTSARPVSIATAASLATSTSNLDINGVYNYAGNTSYWLRYPMWNLYANSYPSQDVGVSYDSDSGLFKPTAGHVRISLANGYNEGGVMKYILSGSKNDDYVDMNNLISDNSNGSVVTIDGSSYAQLKIMGNHANIFVKVD